MGDYNLNNVLAICNKITDSLKSKGIINRQRVSDNQDITLLEVQRRYTRGYQAWLVDDYVAATAEFTWLTLYCPLVPQFHLALAGAMQMQQEFALALSAYACALLIEAQDPEPVYQMAICLLALDKGADARETLQTAIEMSYFSPEYAPTAEKASQLLGRI